MSAPKNEVIKDLRYCKESLDRIIKYTETYYDDDFATRHTVIQSDIIKLRRELNEVNQKLEWGYSRK